MVKMRRKWVRFQVEIGEGIDSVTYEFNLVQLTLPLISSLKRVDEVYHMDINETKCGRRKRTHDNTD